MKAEKSLIVALVVVHTALLFAGCQMKEEPEEVVEPVAEVEVVDPKVEAEKLLLMELGIDENTSLKKADDAEELPSVFLSPPSLPATDADLGISQE